MPPYNNDFRYDYTFAYPDYATTATTNRIVWNTTAEDTIKPYLSAGQVDSLIDIKIKEAFEKLYKKLKEITDMQITEEEFLRVLTE